MFTFAHTHTGTWWILQWCDDWYDYIMIWDLHHVHNTQFITNAQFKAILYDSSFLFYIDSFSFLKLFAICEIFEKVLNSVKSFVHSNKNLSSFLRQLIHFRHEHHVIVNLKLFSSHKLLCAPVSFFSVTAIHIVREKIKIMFGQALMHNVWDSSYMLKVRFFLRFRHHVCVHSIFRFSFYSRCLIFHIRQKKFLYQSTIIACPLFLNWLSTRFWNEK